MKKNIIVLAAACCFSVFANAQGFFIGGSIGAGTNVQKNSEYNYAEKKYGTQETIDESYSFRFEPDFGYTINDDWEIGAGLSFELEKFKTEDLKNNFFGSYIYGRRYFGLTDNLSWFVDAGVEFGLDKSEEYNSSDSLEISKGKSLAIFIEPGLSYEINDHWCVDLTFSFLSLSYGFTWNELLDENDNPYGPKCFNQGLDFGFTTAPGSIHDLSECISVSLTYSF